MNKRDVCDNCCRPYTVCLCSKLPSSPLTLPLRIIILQHPLEARRRLSTVAFLSKCVECMVVVGRKFNSSDKFPQLHNVLQDAISQHTQRVLLYPDGDSLSMVSFFSNRCYTQTQSDAETMQSDVGTCSKDVLILIDGTWKQSKEIFSSMSKLLVRYEITTCRLDMTKQPHLDLPVSETGDSLHLPVCECCINGGEDQICGCVSCARYKLRVEPNAGCLTTMECVGRAILQICVLWRVQNVPHSREGLMGPYNNYDASDSITVIDYIAPIDRGDTSKLLTATTGTCEAANVLLVGGVVVLEVLEEVVRQQAKYSPSLKERLGGGGYVKKTHRHTGV
eukprot:GHVR01009354.1.p1 GENE.GHVR01009354.1~~GHVR01009354.1.p1  ORF type:complete len:336 (+),score=46.75 GHVR01009354.1:45-1052(+)